VANKSDSSFERSGQDAKQRFESFAQGTAHTTKNLVRLGFAASSGNMFAVVALVLVAIIFCLIILVVMLENSINFFDYDSFVTEDETQTVRYKTIEKSNEILLDDFDLVYQQAEELAIDYIASNYNDYDNSKITYVVTPNHDTVILSDYIGTRMIATASVIYRYTTENLDIDSEYLQELFLEDMESFSKDAFSVNPELVPYVELVTYSERVYADGRVERLDDNESNAGESSAENTGGIILYDEPSAVDVSEPPTPSSTAETTPVDGEQGQNVSQICDDTGYCWDASIDSYVRQVSYYEGLVYVSIDTHYDEFLQDKIKGVGGILEERGEASEGEGEALIQSYINETLSYTNYSLLGVYSDFISMYGDGLGYPFDSLRSVSQGLGLNAGTLYNSSGHLGTDFGAPQGTPLYAIASGTVTATSPDGDACQYYVGGGASYMNHYCGITVSIDGADVSYTYAHMMYNPQFSVGEHVEKGQFLGYSGNTGYSTGPHLHLELKASNGARLNYCYYSSGLPLSSVSYNDTQGSGFVDCENPEALAGADNSTD